MRRFVRLMLVLLMSGSLGHAQGIDPDLLAGMKARSIGPAGMSGRVAAIEAVESNADIVYVGAASGGIWKSTNGGLTFRPIFDDQEVASIGALAIFQAHPDIVWAGTGEANTRNSVSVGDGVYRSHDGGETWARAGLENTERIHRIVLHPSDPDTAWVAAPGRLWGDDPERGIFKTTDGGKSWRKVLYVDERTGGADLAMDPSNPNHLIASMWQFRRWPYFFRSGGPSSGLHVSYDGGESWKKLQEEDGLPKGELGRIAVAFSRSEPTVVYALVEAEKSALIRSGDGGRTWKMVNERFDIAPRPFYFSDLRVDPKNSGRIYNLGYTIEVSDDSGTTFSTLISWAAIHGDYHAMWIDPQRPKHLYVGDDGGVAVSRDGGKTALFVATLPLAQFYHVALDMETPYRVYGGLQDNGSWRGPAAVWQQGGIPDYLWELAGGGDGFETKPDPKDPGMVYSLWQGGNLMHVDTRTGETRHIKPDEPDGVKLRFNWDAGMAIDPHDGAIYLGSQFLHRSTDRGETWTTISPDLTTNNPQWQRQEESGGLSPDVSNAENYCTIYTVAPSPVKAGVIWTGSDDGRIHVTQDGGKTWSSVEGNVEGAPLNAWVSHVEASKFDAGTAFAIFDDHRRNERAPYVLRTDDFGKTWRSLVTADLKGYAHVLEQDPVKKDLLYLGTELGLWISLDGGQRWVRWKHGVPPAPVYGLEVHRREHDLVIATHGRAVYVIDDVRPLRGLTPAVIQEPIHLFEGAPAQQVFLRGQPGGFAFGHGQFRGENRPYGAILTFSLNQPKLQLPDEKKERERKEAERAETRRAQGLSWGPFGAKTPAPEAGTSGPAAPEPTPSATGTAEGAVEPEAQPTEPMLPSLTPVPGHSEKTETAPGAAQPEPDKAGGDEEAPKVEILITDSGGTLMRRMKVPAKLGVNRANWDLKRDAFKQLPQEKPPEPDNEPTGPEVPPGVYNVTVKLGEQEAKGTVEVLADPRSKNTEQDWQARWGTIVELGRMNDVNVDAVERVRKTRADVGVIEAKVRDANQELAKTDPKKVEELPVLVAAKKLREGLDNLEKKLWQPYDTKGIVAETSVFSKNSYVYYYLVESWRPASPTHQIYLEQARARLQKAVEEVNAFFAADVSAFRKLAQEGQIGLLVEQAPLSLTP